MRRLRLRQPHGVRRDLRLDGGAHLRRCAEEAVGGDQAAERLVRALEVVVLDEQPEPPLAVRVIRKDRATEELVPQGLPEALDLAEGLRVLRPTLHVADSVLPQSLLELRLPAPGGVLASLVRQHLAGRAVLGNSALQCLDDEAPLLVVRQDERHHVPRMVIQERRHVDALLPTEEEGKDV